jgi:dTDP-4-amino-4,6-dideoxygalactose transaminase
LKPVLVEVDPETFNITAEIFEKAITSKTKVVVPVHLFGQCTDMEPIIELAKRFNIFIVEDTAQAIGADYTFSDGTVRKAGTMGDIGCTSFFPSKNLGCYGDGGALFTNNSQLASTITKIANHGQSKKYHHELIGINSRLDSIQAAILGVKLKYLEDYSASRNQVASFYDKEFCDVTWLNIPKRQTNSSHVFHQYTLKLRSDIDREKLIKFLFEHDIPSMVYYPIPLHMQQAYRSDELPEGSFPISEALCKTVISLPIHTEMTEEQIIHICTVLKSFKNDQK